MPGPCRIRSLWGMGPVGVDRSGIPVLRQTSPPRPAMLTMNPAGLMRIPHMRESYLPTVTELAAFVACARTGATTRAAEEMNLTQSAVSRSLATLEDRLGVRLFHRVRRRLVLSDAGRAFLRDAEPLLADLGRAAVGVMAFGGRADVIRLAVLPSFGTAWLIPRLPAFRALHPQVTFDVTARLTPVDFDLDPFDMAIQRRSLRPPGAEAIDLMEEWLITVASPRLVAGPLDDAGLARLPLLQQSTRPSLWLDWFRDAGMDPRPILRGARFEQFGMLVAAAVAGLGVALLPEAVAEEELARGRLLRVSPRRMKGPDPYAVIAPPRIAAAPVPRAFRDWLAAEAQG